MHIHKHRKHINIEEIGNRGTWTALWKMPPKPIPSLKILLICIIVLLVLSLPLLVTSYTWRITSVILKWIHPRVSTLWTPPQNADPNLSQISLFSQTPCLWIFEREMMEWTVQNTQWLCTNGGKCSHFASMCEKRWICTTARPCFSLF